MVCSHPVMKQRGKIKTSVLAWLSIVIRPSGITLRFTLPVQTENQAPGGGGGGPQVTTHCCVPAASRCENAATVG